VNLGSFVIDDTCTFYVNSHTPSTGAAVDADAVPDYRVYEDETGTPILTGSMAKLDDANTTGFYSEQITLSAANGFEVGKSYCIRMTIVVGGVTGTALRALQVKAAVPTATENADAALKRDWSSVTGESARSTLNALRFLRNKWSISGTTLTVTKEDDTASAWTATVTPDAGADPIVGNDPS
jgi:hypothetical protein